MEIDTTRLAPDIIEFLNKPTTQRFLQVAKEFVELLEDEEIEDKVFLKKIHDKLIGLYHSGHFFEEIEINYSENFRFEREDYFINKYVNKIAFLEKDIYYWHVYDPHFLEEDFKIKIEELDVLGEKVSRGWLIDDFTDIYRDLKIELEKINKGTNETIEDGLWHLSFYFRQHWGIHCITAMRALHFLIYQHLADN